MQFIKSGFSPDFFKIDRFWVVSVLHEMSKIYLIRGNVSRIVRGQDKFRKVTFFKALDKF